MSNTKKTYESLKKMGDSLKILLKREKILQAKIIELRKEGKKLTTQEKRLAQAKRIILYKREWIKIHSLIKPLKRQTKLLLVAYRIQREKASANPSAYNIIKKTPDKTQKSF